MNKYLLLFLYFLAGYATMFAVNVTYFFQVAFLPVVAAIGLFTPAGFWLFKKPTSYKVSFVLGPLGHFLLVGLTTFWSVRWGLVGGAVLISIVAGVLIGKMWSGSRKAPIAILGAVLYIGLIAVGYVGIQEFNLQDSNDASKSGNTFPIMIVADNEGKATAIQSLFSKVTIVTTWTKNCSYCKPLIKDLDAISSSYAPYEVNFIALHAGKDSIDIFQKYSADHELSGRVEYWYDMDTVIMSHFNENTVPWTYLIREDGMVMKAYGGYGKAMQLNFIDQLQDEIEALLME